MKAIFTRLPLAGTCFLMGLAGCDRSLPTLAGKPEQPRPALEEQTAPSEATTSQAIGKAEAEIELEQPASHQPFVAAAALRPSKISAPGTLTLVIRAKTAPGWHIYPADRPAGTSQPTRLELDLPPGVEPAGDWIYPEAIASEVVSDGQLAYEGEFSFQRRLKVGKEAPPGEFRVRCEIHYQACDPFSCRPPETLTVEAAAGVVQNQ